MTPFEIWCRVVDYLAVEDLKNVCRSSKLLNSAATRAIYKVVKFSRFETFKEFRNVVELYFKYIQTLEWNCLDEHGEGKNSVIEVIDYLFSKKCLKNLNIQNLNYLDCLDWNSGFKTLESLELQMTVSDDCLKSILRCDTKLKSLTLERANISSESITLICEMCKSIEKLRLRVDNTNNFLPVSNGITTAMIKNMVENLPNLSSFDIQGINFGNEVYMSLNPLRIKVISFNLGNELIMQEISLVLCKFRNCYKLNIYGTGKYDYTTEEIAMQEDCIFSFPSLCPKLKEINLFNTQVCFVKMGCFLNESNDLFTMKFAKLFPNVELNSFYIG